MCLAPFLRRPPTSLRRAWRRSLAAATAACAVASAAGAESALHLPWPDTLGVVPAGTYALDGRRLGDAHLVSERLPDGTLRIIVKSGIENGARNVAMAILEPVDGDARLRPVVQTSQSFTAEGRSLGILRVDHRRAEASCSPPEADPDSLPDVAAPDARTDAAGVQRLELPGSDRVVNVPLNLLFQPLVRGSAERIDFQIFLCRGGARLWDFQAEVAQRTNDGEPVVEVRYRPNLGPLLTTLASPMLPKLAFWFEGGSDTSYLGHRFSLYTKGPEVVVARDGATQSVFQLAP